MRRKNNVNRSDIATAILQLTKAINIPAVCCSASHCRKVSPRVIAIVSRISRPIYIRIVGIKPLCCRLDCKLEQIVVRVSRMPVDTIHALENSARKDACATNFTDALDGSLQKCLNHHSTFRESARTIVDTGKRSICYPRGFLSSSSYGFP